MDKTILNLKTRDLIIVTTNFALFIFASILSIITVPISTVYFLFWFLLTSFTYIVSKDKLTRFELIIVLIFTYGYIVAETILKILMDQGTFDGNEIWANMFEHALFSFSIGIIIYPLLKSEFAKISSIVIKVLLIIGIVNILGIGNEIMEAIVRELNDSEKLVYYKDTIYDLGMNVLGGTLAAIAILILEGIAKSGGQPEGVELSEYTEPASVDTMETSDSNAVIQ